MADNFRLRVINDRPVRLRVRPSLLPQEIELQNTGTVVQWRYVGQADDAWVDLIERHGHNRCCWFARDR
jgi:hypothetical protein